ncbi:MAG: hypothetical protein AABW58_02260 [Nanoarchaeota archaeon]
MTKIYLYYDEEGDYLEINIGKYVDKAYEDLGNGIAEMIDEKENVVGVNVAGFIKKIRKMKEIKLPFLMNSYLTILYDEKRDFFQLSLGKTGNNIDVFNFKKKTKNLKDIEINLPLEIVS